MITLEGRATPSFGENPGILITEAATSGGIFLHSRDWSALSAAYVLKSVPNVHVFVHSTNAVLRRVQNTSIFSRVDNIYSIMNITKAVQ